MMLLSDKRTPTKLTALGGERVSAVLQRRLHGAGSTTAMDRSLQGKEGDYCTNVDLFYSGECMKAEFDASVAECEDILANPLEDPHGGIRRQRRRVRGYSCEP